MSRLEYTAKKRQAQDELREQEATYGPEDAGQAVLLRRIADLELRVEPPDLAEAERYLRRAVDVLRKQRGEQDIETMDMMQRLGEVVQRQGNFGDAAAWFLQVLEGLRATLGEHHPRVAAAATQLVENEDKLAARRSRDAAAEAAGAPGASGEDPFGDAALARVSSRVNPRPDVFGGDDDPFADPPPAAEGPAVDPFRDLGGGAEERKKRLKLSLASTAALLGADDPALVPILRELAEVAALQGDPAHAEALLARALGIARSAHGAAHPEAAYVACRLAEACFQQGKTAEAEVLLADALPLLRAAHTAGDARVIVATGLMRRLAAGGNGGAPAQGGAPRSPDCRRAAASPRANDCHDEAIELDGFDEPGECPDRDVDTPSPPPQEELVFEEPPPAPAPAPEPQPEPEQPSPSRVYQLQRGNPRFDEEVALDDFDGGLGRSESVQTPPPPEGLLALRTTPRHANAPHDEVFELDDEE